MLSCVLTATLPQSCGSDRAPETESMLWSFPAAGGSAPSASGRRHEKDTGPGSAEGCPERPPCHLEQKPWDAVEVLKLKPLQKQKRLKSRTHPTGTWLWQAGRQLEGGLERSSPQYPSGWHSAGAEGLGAGPVLEAAIYQRKHFLGKNYKHM